MKRKDHYRITWNPSKSSIFHAQTLNWSSEFGKKDSGKDSQDRSGWKSVIWPERSGWSWRQRLAERLVARTQTKPEIQAAARPRRFFPVDLGKGSLSERRKALNLPAVDWLAVVWGWVAALATTLVILAAAAFYVALTPGSVYYLSTYLFLNKVVSPLLGGVLAGVRTRQAAGLVGFWVGMGYGLIVLVFRLYGGLFSTFWSEAVTGLLASLLAGVVGAIVGFTLSESRASRERRRGLAAG